MIVSFTVFSMNQAEVMVNSQLEQEDIKRSSQGL